MRATTVPSCSGADQSQALRTSPASTGLELRLQFTFPAADVPGGRPSEFEMGWEEVTPDGSGGTYVMTVQGAVVGAFRYIRKKDGKVFRFEEDPDAAGEERCEWKEK